MKDKYFNDALNSIDSDIVDEFIMESEKIERKKRVRGAFLRYGTVAASFCVILSIATVFANLYPYNQPPIILTQSTSGQLSDIPSNPTDADYLKLIYETNGAYYGSEKGFNHSNIISSSIRYLNDESAPLTRKIILNGVEEQLYYENSLYYPIYDTTVHCYLLNGKEECKVYIRQDGSIDGLGYDFAKIDILQNNTPEEVLPKLKELLEKYVDLSKYKHIEMPYDSSKDDGGVGFGTYSFVFYNLTDGYRTDFLRVGVDYS